MQGEQVQAGRAVDEDEVIVLLHPGQRLTQAALAARQVDHFQAGTGQTGVGADHIGAELGLADCLCGGRLADEHLVGAALHAPLGDAVAGGGVALGVQIHDQDLLAQRRHTGTQVDGGGCFANAALLVCYCDDFCHAVPPLFLRFLGGTGPLGIIIAQKLGIKKGLNRKKPR